MRDLEDYSRARTLATVSHHGETFRIVRRRVRGKPWRKYLTLCHGAISVSDYLLEKTTDPQEAARLYESQLQSTFNDRESLLNAIQEIVTERSS